MKKLFIAIFSLLTILLATGCSNTQSYDIITSSFPIYDLTVRIAKDKMTVKNLVKAGVEPHDYEPSARDVASLLDSKIFIVNGLGFEHYTTSLTDEIKDKMFTCTEGITTIESTKGVDPHVWLDPQNAIKMMENVKDKLISIDSENEAYYTANFLKSKELFTNLDNSYKTSLENLSSRYLITSHNAFGYLCNAYNLTQISISGLSPDDEPTPQAISNLIKQIEGLNATTIFSEELVSDTVAKSIASQTGLKCDVLSPIEGLASDDSTDDYISLMEANLEAIVKALS